MTCFMVEGRLKSQDKLNDDDTYGIYSKSYGFRINIDVWT